MVFLRKYGTGTGADVYVPVVKRAVVDFAVGADWTPASGDVKVSIDGGAAANIGTLPTAVAMGNTAYWKFVLSDAELQGKVIIVTVADSATKAVEDQAFVVETYGHASAKFIADLSLANLPANVVQFGGTNATTSSGRPEVNMTHIAGSAVSTSTAQLGVNVVNFGGAAGTFASGRPEVNTTHIAGTAYASTTLFTLASHDPGATIGTSTLTQTQVTGGAYSVQSASCVLGDARIANLDTTVSSRGTSTLTQTQVTGGAYSVQSASCVLGDARIGNLDATVSSRSTLTQTQVTGGAYSMASSSQVLGDTRIANLDATISSRVAATIFTGITSLAQWLGLIAGKQTGNTTARTEIRATGAGSGTYDETTDSQEALRDRGDAAWTTATGFATSAALATAQADLDTLTGADGATLATSQPNYAPATAAALASLVTTVGVAGAGLTEAGGTGDHLTAIDLPDQTMNITGNITGNLSGSVGSVTGAVGSVTGAVGSVTGNVGGNVTGSVGSVVGAVGSVTGNVGGNVTGSVGSLATQAKADVNAEVVDCLNVDTYAEIGQEAPAATNTIRKMLGYLFKSWRNKKEQTATTFKLYDDAGTTVDQKATVSDDGTTYTDGEIGSGP